METLSFIHYCRDVRVVGFYDRASTKAQLKNGMRSASCREAVKFCAAHDLTLIGSGDPRNNGICFLDCGTGADAYNRPELKRMLADERIDTIVTIFFDRYARGVEVHEQLLSAIKLANKNIAHITDLDSEMQLRRILGAYAR